MANPKLDIVELLPRIQKEFDRLSDLFLEDEPAGQGARAQALEAEKESHKCKQNYLKF